MKKTIQINLGGRHFQIDEDAFQKLNHYLELLKSHFASEGDSGKEIIEDIEQRVAEILENKITENNQAVSLADVDETIGILGKVEDFIYAGTTQQSREHDVYGRREYRRFFRDEENNYIGGVAAGLGAYFDIDPLWIRLALVALIFLKGVGILIYAIIWIVVPKARTTAEKLQMRGLPVTLATIKESVNTEYTKVRAGLNNLGSSAAAERTRNALGNLVRAVGLVFVALFKFIIGAIGVILLILGTLFLTMLILMVLGFTNLLGHFQIWNDMSFPDYSHLFASSGHYHLILISLVIVMLIPVIGLMYGGIKIIFNIRTRHPVLRAFILTTWIVALVLCISLVAMNASNFAVEANDTQSVAIENRTFPRLYIEVRDNSDNKKITRYSIFDEHFNYSEDDQSIYTEPVVTISNSGDQGMYLAIEKHANNVGIRRSREFLDRIRYNWEQKDSMVYIDRFQTTDDDDFWMFSRVKVDLRIPEGQEVIISNRVCDLLDYDQHYRYCGDTLLAGKPVVMAADGLVLPDKQKSKSKKNK